MWLATVLRPLPKPTAPRVVVVFFFHIMALRQRDDPSEQAQQQQLANQYKKRVARLSRQHKLAAALQQKCILAGVQAAWPGLPALTCRHRSTF